MENRSVGDLKLDGDSVGIYWTLVGPQRGYLDAVLQYTDLDGQALHHADAARGVRHVDDGAVVWLNGTEVYRHNLPAGPVSHTTPAIPDEADARRLFAAFGLDSPFAVMEAPDAVPEGLRYPVALKILSPDLAHKTDPALPG